MAIKSYEYADVLGAGTSLSTSTFWFFYLFVTGQTLAAILLLIWCGAVVSTVDNFFSAAS